MYGRDFGKEAAEESDVTHQGKQPCGQYFSVPHRFLQDSQDSSGLLYNFGDFELIETNTDKSPGILRTGTEFLLN